MKNYLVISYDSDEEQAFWDTVHATTDRRAQEIVAKVRGDYAMLIDLPLTSEELREIADRMDANTKAPRNVRDFRKAIRA